MKIDLVKLLGYLIIAVMTWIWFVGLFNVLGWAK